MLTTFIDRFEIKNVDDICKIDMIDFRLIESYNDGYKYILVIVAALSECAWVEKMRDKSVKSSADAFAAILNRALRHVAI